MCFIRTFTGPEEARYILTFAFNDSISLDLLQLTQQLEREKFAEITERKVNHLGKVFWSTHATTTLCGRVMNVVHVYLWFAHVAGPSAIYRSLIHYKLLLVDVLPVTAAPATEVRRWWHIFLIPIRDHHEHFSYRYLHRTSAVYTFEGRRRFDLHLVILISATELNQVLVDARAILDEVCCRCALRQRVIKQQLLLAILLLTSAAFLLRIRLRNLKDVLLSSLLRIVTFKTLTQNSLLLVTVKKDWILDEASVDELLSQALGLVITQLNVFIVDLFKFHES